MPALVQHAGSSTEAAGATITENYAADTTATNPLIAWAIWQDAALNAAVADNINGGWVMVENTLQRHAEGFSSAYFIKEGGAGGAAAVTLTVAGSVGYKLLMLVEATAAASGAVNAAASSSGSDSAPTVDIETTHDDCLILAACLASNAASNVAPFVYVFDVDGNAIEVLADATPAGTFTPAFESNTFWNIAALALSDTPTGGGGDTGALNLRIDGAWVAAKVRTDGAWV